MPKPSNIRLTTHHYLGIDPGQEGAAVLLRHTATYGSVPYVQENGLPWYIRFDKATDQEVHQWLAQVAAGCPHLKVAIESVHSMPKQGVASSFKFGKSYGFLLGLLTALQVRYINPTPQSWQKEMNCRTKGDKNISKAEAHRRWPKYIADITHKTADAMLIAASIPKLWDRYY